MVVWQHCFAFGLYVLLRQQVKSSLKRLMDVHESLKTCMSSEKKGCLAVLDTFVLPIYKPLLLPSAL